MTKSTLFLMLFGVVLNMTAAEVSSPKQEETSATHERTIYQALPVTRSILRSSKNILTKSASNQDYTADLKIVVDAQKNIEHEKLKVVAALTRQYAAQKEKNASTETLTHIDEQRRRWVARYNEISRLLTLIAESKDQATQLDKVKQLVTFLEPPQVPQSTSLNRGAITDTTPKNSTPKEQDKEKKK